MPEPVTNLLLAVALVIVVFAFWFIVFRLLGFFDSSSESQQRVVIKGVKVRTSGGGRVSVFSGNRSLRVQDSSVEVNGESIIVNGSVDFDKDRFLNNVPPKARSVEEETADLERLRGSLQRLHRNSVVRSQSNPDGTINFVLIKLDTEEYSFTHADIAKEAGRAYDAANPRPAIPEIPKIPDIRMPWDDEEVDKTQ